MDISNDGDNAMITIIGAIDAIKPDVECAVYDSESIDNFTVVWGNAEDEIERSVIVKKYNDMQEEWTAQEYARNRALSYPSTGDQLDMIYKDMKNSTTTHADAVEVVKTKYPKE
jgi:hypothetical protein